MGIGISIFLIAVGAVLTFAMERAVEGIDLDVVGVILMIVGAVGLLFSGALFSDDRWFYRGPRDPRP